MSSKEITGLVIATALGGVVAFFVDRYLSAKFPPPEPTPDTDRGDNLHDVVP